MKLSLSIGLAVACVPLALAQNLGPTELAKADLERAMALSGEKDSAAAISAAKRAVEEDPDLVPAHEAFIKLTEDSIITRDGNFAKTEAEAVDRLTTQYNLWAQKFPNSAGVQYGYGSLYYNAEDPRAKPFLLKAVALNPRLAKAFYMLSIDASRWGDDRAARDYMGKASAAAASEAEYALEYASSYQELDPKKYTALSLEVAKRFPDSVYGAFAIFELAENSSSDADKVRYLEQERTVFPPGKADHALWGQHFSVAMGLLFDVYARTAPDKALELARDMLVSTDTATDPSNSGGWPSHAAEWKNDVALAQNLIAVRKLLATNQFEEAKTLLDQSKLGRISDYFDQSKVQMFELLKAEAAAGSGDTKGAYDALLARYSKTPEDAVHDAILKYGGDLGKSPAQVENDIWALRDGAAKPAPEFDLEAYLTKGKKSLEDYRGKVVLLTFWFPGCGPCRGEFPHFENVMKKFRDQNVAYVGINVLPSQDEYVRPFMKGTRFSFTPLRGDSQFAANVYHIRGEPTNFLIDQTGRIVFSDFRTHDPESERVLQLMIQSLLDHHLAAQ